MDDAAVRKLVEAIDAQWGDESPRSHITGGKTDGYMFVTANREGCLRLARFFLVAAAAPLESDRASRPITIDAPHTQVCGTPGDLAIGWGQRAEVVPIPEDVIARRKRESWKRDRWALLGCSIVGFLLISLIVSGLFFWIAIITGNPRFLP